MFGVGGLVSPLIVLLFEENAYFVIGTLMFVICPAYFFLESP
jgi:hypothetical protein